MLLNRASEVSSIVDKNMARQLLDQRLMRTQSVRGGKADVSRIFLARNSGIEEEKGEEAAQTPTANAKETSTPYKHSPSKVVTK